MKFKDGDRAIVGTSGTYNVNDLVWVEYNGKKQTYEDMIQLYSNVDYYLDSSTSKTGISLVSSSSGIFNGKNVKIVVSSEYTGQQSIHIWDTKGTLKEFYGIDVTTPCPLTLT